MLRVGREEMYCVFLEVNASELRFQRAAYLFWPFLFVLAEAALTVVHPFLLCASKVKLNNFITTALCRPGRQIGDSWQGWKKQELIIKDEKTARRRKEEKKVKIELVRYFTQLDSTVVLNAVSTVNLALSFFLTPPFLRKVNWEVKQWQTDVSWLFAKLSPLWSDVITPTEDINSDPSCS